MTDEDRQKLISTLRSIAVWQGLTPPVREAADEIERLAALTQPDAEPVAWQVRAKGSPDWYIWEGNGLPYDNVDPEFYEVRSLYTVPPRPDASAGLIEAADYLIDRLQACLKGDSVRDLGEALAAYGSVRARAADRSGK